VVLSLQARGTQRCKGALGAGFSSRLDKEVPGIGLATMGQKLGRGCHR